MLRPLRDLQCVRFAIPSFQTSAAQTWASSWCPCCSSSVFRNVASTKWRLRKCFAKRASLVRAQDSSRIISPIIWSRWQRWSDVTVKMQIHSNMESKGWKTPRRRAKRLKSAKQRGPWLDLWYDLRATLWEAEGWRQHRGRRESWKMGVLWLVVPSLYAVCLFGLQRNQGLEVLFVCLIFCCTEADDFVMRVAKAPLGRLLADSWQRSEIYDQGDNTNDRGKTCISMDL